MTPAVVEDPKLAALAAGYAERQEPLPPGRWGTTTRADLDATRLRIIHGIIKKAVDAGEVGVVAYLPAEEEE